MMEPREELWREYTSELHFWEKLTHDGIARYIGSIREVVTKVLNYFVQENVVTLGCGKVQITEHLKEYL